MRVTDVARVERVGRNHLRTMAFVDDGNVWTLSRLLFGKPLSMRAKGDTEELCDALNQGLKAGMEVLSWEVGPCDALSQAQLEWNRIVQMPPTLAGVAAKRAALLFAMHHVPALSAAFATHEPDLVQDLSERVLPVTIPSFVAGMGQCPEQLMLLVTTLTQLWPKEPMGMGVGMGTTSTAAHVEESERVLRDGADAEG